MVSRSTLHLSCCTLLVVVLLASAAPTGAAPPPRPLCDACGDSFEETASAHGVDVTVERSTASVAVRENGSATWVVHNDLAGSDGAQRLRTNASLRTGIADRAMWDTTLLGSEVSDDGTLTLRYRETDFAERSIGGAYHSGAFTERFGYRSLDGLGADRLVVTAPPGTRVGWTVPGATVSGDGRRMTVTELQEYRVVTFVPDDAVAGPLLGVLAAASLFGPLLALQALAYAALPAGVFTVVVGAIAGALSWLDRDLGWGRDSGGAALAAGGAALAAIAALAAVGGVLGVGGWAPLFGVGAALGGLGIALSRPALRERTTYWTLVGAALAGTVVAAGLAVAGALLTGSRGLTLSLVTTLPVVGPLFALLPAGYAAGQGRRWLAMATAGLGFLLPMVPALPILPSPLGLGLLLVLPAVGGAALLATVGAPLFVLGRSLANARTSTETADSATP